jgi:2-(1,2-epoxy-1,2-dihydrophenyl)acetyl-CoA isomerase
MEPKVRVIKENEVALVTLNRPEVYNALDEEMLKLLAEHMADLGLDKTVRAVVITGEGKAFCAGGDLRSIHAFAGGMGKGVYELATFFHQAVQEIRQMKKPVVAAINGVAAGGGFSLALACDFRVMARSAVLRQAYTSSGLSPGDWSPRWQKMNSCLKLPKIWPPGSHEALCMPLACAKP